MVILKRSFFIIAMLATTLAGPVPVSAQNNCMSACSYGDLNACTQCQQTSQLNSHQVIFDQSQQRQMQVQQQLNQMQQRQLQQQINQPRLTSCQVSGGIANCTSW